MSKNEKRGLPLSDKPRKRQAKSSDVSISLNEIYLKDDVIENFTNAFKEKKSVNLENGALFSTEPFSHFVLPNFISNQRNFLEWLKYELTDLNFYEKNSDLFKFSQSDDLKNANTPYIRAMKKLLYENFLEWLQKVTGIPLDATVDMTAARYEYTDTLLCHDDELEGRRIAYIYYMVNPWKESDGGTLDLFNTDAATGQPDKVANSLVPENNKLVFFEVSPVSFHQVREVINEDKVRLSVSGWFHGPPLPAASHPEQPTLFRGPGHVEEQLLEEWINPVYLSPATQMQVQAEFLNNYQVELLDFLKKDKHMALVEELINLESWKPMGPPNRKNYRRAEVLPPLAQQLNQMFNSEAMFVVLSNLTGMALHNLVAEESCDGESASQLCRWGHGDYTLVWDTDPDASLPTLDATLFLDYDSWCEEFGGVVVFVGPSEVDEQQEYLSVHPRTNSLALVFRTAGTNRFTKHLNHRCGNLTFHTLQAMYRQRFETAE